MRSSPLPVRATMEAPSTCPRFRRISPLPATIRTCLALEPASNSISPLPVFISMDSVSACSLNSPLPVSPRSSTPRKPRRQISPLPERRAVLSASAFRSSASPLEVCTFNSPAFSPLPFISPLEVFRQIFAPDMSRASRVPLAAWSSISVSSWTARDRSDTCWSPLWVLASSFRQTTPWICRSPLVHWVSSSCVSNSLTFRSPLVLLSLIRGIPAGICTSKSILPAEDQFVKLANMDTTSHRDSPVSASLRSFTPA